MIRISFLLVLSFFVLSDHHKLSTKYSECQGKIANYYVAEITDEGSVKGWYKAAKMHQKYYADRNAKVKVYPSMQYRVDEENNTTDDLESSDLVEVEELEPVSDLESPVAVDENPKIESNNKNESIDSSIVDENKPSTKIIDERAIFKNNSSSESGSKGSSLEMQGWIWDFEPNPIDNSRESGRIIFEIIVDYYGEIIGLRTLEKTLSPAIENIYKEEILKLTFSPTNNENPAEISKGKITFIIKNN